jgi:ribosomal protein L20A (L18A)
LIEELEAMREDLDFRIIKENLEKYPHIKKFIGLSWFERKQKERNRTHPLLISLSRNIQRGEIEGFVKKFRATEDPMEKWGYSILIRRLLYPSAFLNHLDTCLSVIKRNEKGSRGLREGLKNEDKFSATISEIETIYLLRERYGISNVEIEPEIKVNESGKIKSKYLDCKVETAELNFLVEVVNPNLMEKLKYSSKAICIKNRAIEIIYEEFAKKHKIKYAIDIEELPLIFVIDIGRSEIDEIFIESTFEGSPQITLLFDKQTGKAVAEYPSRAKDSLHYVDVSTEFISGILYYRSTLGDDGKIVSKAKFIPNPYAKNPISKKIRKELES